MLNVGDSVGAIYKRVHGNFGYWFLKEDKITEITETKHGRKYLTEEFYPLDTDEVDSATRRMEDAISKGYIIKKEVFWLNERTRPFVEEWVKWANENWDKAVSILKS